MFRPNMNRYTKIITRFPEDCGRRVWHTFFEAVREAKLSDDNEILQYVIGVFQDKEPEVVDILNHYLDEALTLALYTREILKFGTEFDEPNEYDLYEMYCQFRECRDEGIDCPCPEGSCGLKVKEDVEDLLNWYRRRMQEEN